MFAAFTHKLVEQMHKIIAYDLNVMQAEWFSESKDTNHGIFTVRYLRVKF